MVELGCGYGTFPLPVAQRIGGTLTTFDVDETMIERTRQRAAAAGLWNIVYIVRDVFADGFGRAAESKDAGLLFNILHCEEPLRLLTETARVVRPGGAVMVIHWRYDPAMPRGPGMAIRPKPEQILDWAEQTNPLKPVGPTLALPPWHYRSLRKCLQHLSGKSNWQERRAAASPPAQSRRKLRRWTRCGRRSAPSLPCKKFCNDLYGFRLRRLNHPIAGE